MEAGGPEEQAHPRLHGEFDASLGYKANKPLHRLSCLLSDTGWPILSSLLSFPFGLYFLLCCSPLCSRGYSFPPGALESLLFLPTLRMVGLSFLTVKPHVTFAEIPPGSWACAKLVECLPSVQKALNSVPSAMQGAARLQSTFPFALRCLGLFSGFVTACVL